MLSKEAFQITTWSFYRKDADLVRCEREMAHCLLLAPFTVKAEVINGVRDMEVRGDLAKCDGADGKVGTGLMPAFPNIESLVASNGAKFFAVGERHVSFTVRNRYSQKCASAYSPKHRMVPRLCLDAEAIPLVISF